MNAHINNNTTTPNYIRILQTLPTYINGNFTYLNNNYAYIIFNSNGSILFKEDTPCELLIVGAGGRGGIFSIFGGAGGGGSGEIIYNPSFTFSSNSYDIIVGIDNADSNQRISKIIANNQIIINANGGGDGAFWDGVSYGEIQRFPPQSFTSNSPILNTTFLNRSCYKSTIYVNSNPYEVFYSSRKENTSFDAINLFNCLEPSSTYEAVFLNEQYNNSGATFNYLKSNFIIDFRYKGDWVCIKLPIPILLTSYSFFQNETETGGAPNNFKIYGSTNGIDWDVVKDRNLFVNLSYLNYKYTEVLSPLPTKPYLYYALVVNSLVGNLSYLNFNEWVLNGKPIIITPSTMNGGSSVFNLPSNQIQGGFGGSYINQNLIKIIKENSSINIPYDNYFFKINRNPLNTYINSGIYSAVFNEGFITFANETYLSFPILTSIEPEYWYKFNSSSGFNDNFIITGTIIKNLNDIYFNYGVYLKPFINELWNSNGISFSFWIKPELEIGNNLWIFKTIDNPNEFISFHNNEFKISNNGLITSVNFNINLLDGLYHHFVCSIDPSGKIILACDGIIYENSSVNPFINKSYKDGRIGEFFQGYMKDFRIYLKVLDFNEIQELFKGRIEIFYNRFNENITTTNIQIGSGGIGGTSNSIPTIKNYYGDGGDGNREGNLGLGFQGIVIIKYPYPYFKTTLTSYKFPNSQFLKFSGLNNSNGIPFKLLTNNNDNRVLSINDLNFHISSNEPYIQSTSNIDINNTLFINSNGNIGFGKNLGINIIAEEINPIAWYKFDDPNNLGKDEFNSYNLTLVNNPIFNSTIFNKGIGCISLSRQNNQYLILNNLNLTNLSFSISLWSYLLNYDNVLTPLFYKGNENEYFIISYRFNNTIDFGFNGYILSAENLPNDTNIWINWVFTYDNDNKIIRIYRNGLKIAEDFFPYFFHITHDYNIGRALVNQIERYFDGNIDDFRIYNKVLNDNQIQELYNGKVEIYSYNNNINFETNIGINNSLSINDFTIQKYNSNISFINPSGFNGIGTTNPLNFLDIRNDVYMSKLNINSLDITLINTNQNSLFIRDNSIIKFNYINDTKINSGFYNINFINGSIILDSLNPDKSYPILKDLYSIEKEYPPNKYDSFTTEIISSGEIFNINPSNYYKETITYKNQIYEIYSSGTTNDIARTRARLFNKNAIYSFSDIGAYWGYNNYNTITGIQRNNRYIINDYLGEWCIIKFPVSFILTKYIISVQTEYLIRAPSLIRFYGSFDGINWNIIQEAEISTPLTSNNYSSFGIYEKILNDTFNISYLYIGFTINKIIGDPNGSNFTPLSIAELRIFGKEIEENIINPIVWYKFDNSSNQMLLDSSSNNYNLTNNGATFDTTTFIKGNGSINFNHSSSQYISIPSINLYNIQSVNGISFCLWFKMNTIDTGTWPRIFDFNNGNITTPRWILISRYLIDNKLNFDIYNGNIQISRITTNNYIDDNWHHIVWSINNLGNWIIYIDGLIATFTETLPTNVNIENINFTNNNFGKSLYNLDGYLSGNIDDFRIYNFVLNYNQVQELYKGRIEIYTYQNSNNNLNIFGNAMISQTADIGNLILNGVIYKNNGIPYFDSGWTTMLEDKSNIFNSYSVVGIGTIFPRFQNRLDVNGSILCDDIFVNGALLTNDYIKKSGTIADTISLGTLKISSGGTGVNSFTSNQILNSTIVWSNNSLNILGNINNSNIINNNEKIVLNNGIKIGNINIDNYGISNGNSNSNIIIGNNFFINSNVGIGTTNPNNLLDIHGNMRINRVLEVNNISNNEILNGISMNISNINIENSGIINRYLSRWGNSNNFMEFVGIGTTNPINSLDIIGNVGIKGILNVSYISNTNIFNGFSMNVSNINIENSVINYKNNNNFIGSRWNLSNTNIVYNSGFVGITTNILNSNLNVNGNFSMKGFLNMNNSNISNINWFSGKTLKVNNLRFLTNSSGIINFINGSTFNINNWTTINDLNSTKIYQTFNYTGTIQTFNIPDGIKSINIYCWGAGGGSSSNISNIGGYGGNGGFVSATLSISSISSLKIIVGQGGKKGIISSESGRSYGGGGYGKSTDNNWALGGGGGLSGIFIDNANTTINADGIINTNAIPILIAGGGGGAGATSNTYHGGNAGGTIGNNGNANISGGTGGTQSAGGTGNGNGSKYNGGVSSSYGGGGGAGWFGGGSGNVTTANVTSGGGGSSYLNTSGYTLTNTYIPNAQANGTRTAQENTNKYYQTGIGLGADRPLMDGGNGLIVIEYNIQKVYYNYGNVGIRTSINQSNSIDINGDLNFNSNISNNNNQIFNFENFNGLITTNPIVNITNNSLNNSYGYYQFPIANTITFNRDLLCDVLVVGAGGNGGAGAYAGGGGAGEVIYQPNYLFEKGSYNLSVGTSSTTANNRISKITKGTTDIFKALGGGDGNVAINSVLITGTSNSINIAVDNTNYRYAEFKSNGTFVIDNDLECEILIVGGGGGGGRNDGMEGGGGGGAGGVGIGSIYLKKGITYNITIGNGGDGAINGNTNGSNGLNTTIIGDLISETAYGGGGGGWKTASNGGSGGGSSGYGGDHNGGTATKGLSSSGINSSIIYYGNNGGYGYWQSGGSGGGGANSEGSITGARNRLNGANGGNGIETSITGISTYYGGGGGGGCGNGGTSIGFGGLGGGGNGGNRSNPTSGTANTGGGGGGSSGSNGGNGGSGIIIIRYISTNSGENQIISKNSSIRSFRSTLLLNYVNNIIVNSRIFNINFDYGFISVGESPYVKPWGSYFASDWSGTTLLDSSGNGRHATTSSGNITITSGSGNGASGNITYISGGTSSTISWPSGSIPNNFTILSLTRYNGSTKRRILQGQNKNWLHGHWFTYRAVCHYEYWVTDTNRTLGIQDDWLCCIGKNSSSGLNSILADGTPIGGGGGSGNDNLRLNLGAEPNETSDWALCCVIIYDSHLTNYHMIKLNNFINTYKTSGNLDELKTNIIGKIDKSYPIIKGEKQYPPKLYDSSTNETTNTGELTGINPSTYYKGTFTINQYTNGYGIGTYTIYSSSYCSADTEKKLLFNFNNSDGNTHWTISSIYSAQFGNYIGSSYIKSDYKGDWIIIKLPNSIILNRFVFYIRSSFVSRSPGLWKCYGSNDGITFTEILEASNTAKSLTSDNYSLGYYQQIFTTFSISYSYIGFTFNKLVGGDDNAYVLNFSEIQLFAKDDNIINPIVWYKFDGSSTFLNENYNSSNNITNNGATYDITNFIKGDGSINFVASSSQYAIIPNNFNWNAINSANGISFSWWAKNNSSSGSWARLWDFGVKNTNNANVGSRYIMVSKYENTTNNRFALTDYGENGTGGNSYTYDTSGTNYFDGNWRHYVWTISSTGIWNIYINNSNILNNSQKIAIPTMTQINIINNLGRSLYSSDGYYDGNLDDFRIYNFVLTPSQVNDLYNGRIDVYNLTSLNNIISYSTAGSGGGSYYNSNNQSLALTKWNNIYSYISSGNIGSSIRGGNGGSSLINSTYNLTGTNQIIGIGGLGATSVSASSSKSFGCGGDGNGGSGGSGLIIIKILKEIRNFNLTRNYLFNNGTDYTILTDNNNNIINPIIWYKFDGSLTFLNDINNLNNLLNYDGIYDTSNYVKGIGSIYFNNPSTSSTQKYAVIPNNVLPASYLNTLNLTNGLSFSFWIKLSSASVDYNRILYFGNFQIESPYYDNTNYRLQIRTSTPKTTAIYFDIIKDGFYTFQYDTNIYDNTWKHIVWTISPSGIWNIYINNLLICDNEAKIVFPLLSSTNLIYLLGIDKHPDNYGIIGNFDDFRIYNHVLNKSQVSELYENSRINFIINGNSFSKGTNYISSINDYPLLTYANSNIINPIAWYKFDDSTNLGKDEMDNHNLTNNSSVSYNSTNFIKGTGSSSFNGTNQFLSKTSAFNLNSKDFSICFWINRTSNNRRDEIIVIGSSTLALQFLNIAINDTNKIAFNWSQENFISDNAYTDAGTWVHLCFTYKTGIKIKTIYRNGIVIKAGSTLNEVLTGNDIRIGADLNSRFFQGLLDDLRIYDFELSQSQVLELYNTTNNYQTLINYPTNYFSSYSSNLHNPFIRTSNNDLEILSYTNNDINSILLQSNIKLITNNSNQLIINSNLISINKSLDISGNSGTITNEAGAYITTSSSAFLSGYMPEYTTFSLKTFDNIICGKNSYALSDKRIKTNISNIDDMNSLEKILKIEPKIYGYIDNIQRTNSNVYGFLAQQIRDVLPEATELTTKFIPDIFKLTKINGNRINLNDEELKKINIEDILEIYTKNNSYQVKVINKDNYGININIDIIDNDIFIYGRQVKDFHIIDKSYLYTLNICATQELARIVEGLKQRINNL